MTREKFKTPLTHLNGYESGLRLSGLVSGNKQYLISDSNETQQQQQQQQQRHQPQQHQQADNDCFIRSADEDDYLEDSECKTLIDDDHRSSRLNLSGVGDCAERVGANLMRNERGPTFADVIIDYFRSSRIWQSHTSDSIHYPGADSRRTAPMRPGSSKGGKFPPTAPRTTHKPITNRLKPWLLIILFMLLIACFIVLLVKLTWLIHDQRLVAQSGHSSNLIALQGTQVGPVDVHEDEVDERKHQQDENDEGQEAEAEAEEEANQRDFEAQQMSRWLVSTRKCHIPVLDPWDSSIRSYVHQNRPLNCSQLIRDSMSAPDKHKARVATTESLTYVRDNKLYFLPEAIQMGALAGRCCYRQVLRSIENDDDLEFADECVAIHANGLTINRSLIQVSCIEPLNYVNVHSFVVHNKEEEEALRRVAEVKLNKPDYYNILMVGIDTMSRSNAQRQLSETLNVLKSKLYETIDFTGYNKVGENTFPNLIPFLTGLRPDQLTETQCWMVKNYTDEDGSGNDFLDNCKYLWNFYQQIGYTTYFSEDWPSASTFNYLKPGFKSEPTTYYGRPFVLARDKLTFSELKSIGCASCHLNQPLVQVDLARLENFIREYKEGPYFAFHWSNCPHHDNMNEASKVDRIIANFFLRIHNMTQNERTFVLFFSDHGYRWNKFVSTRIGHYESSLPLLTIAAPRLFRQRHPDLYERLKNHQNSLVTPFDLFKTMIAIKNLSSNKLEHPRGVQSKRQAVLPIIPFASPDLAQSLAIPMDVALVPAMRYPASLPESIVPTEATAEATTYIEQVNVIDGVSMVQKFKSISLLDEHTKEELDRSCTEAGIPDNYCVCHQFKRIPRTRLDVLGAAYHLVYRHMASRLRDHLALCSQLDLDEVHKAGVFDFEQSPATKEKTISRQRRRALEDESRTEAGPKAADNRGTTTVSGASRTYESGAAAATNPRGQPKATVDDRRHNDQHHDEEVAMKYNYLPNREYSLMLSTKPGKGLFQEVVRYYGKNMTECELQVERSRKILEDRWASHDDKQATVWRMNRVCEFSVHSESISRLNLYKEQAGCIKSNIELKKICYCNNLL